MNTRILLKKRFLCAVLGLAFANLAVVELAQAKQGATDPIPGTSKGTVSSGGGSGGGGKSTTPTPAPAPAPVTSGVLTFSAPAPIGDITPVCSGSYQIDPYYPTLSLLTVTVSVDSVNLPDNSALYVNVQGSNGTLYPFTANAIVITAGSGICSYSVYVTPGTTLTSVTVSDASGSLISVGY